MTNTEFIEESKRHIKWESQRQERYEKRLGEELNKVVIALQEHRLDDARELLFISLRFIDDIKEIATEREVLCSVVDTLTEIEEA